jgi:hypothetical protein
MAMNEQAEAHDRLEAIRKTLWALNQTYTADVKNAEAAKANPDPKRLHMTAFIPQNLVLLTDTLFKLTEEVQKLNARVIEFEVR